MLSTATSISSSAGTELVRTGGVVSITISLLPAKEFSSPIAGSFKTALFPTGSVIFPPFKDKAEIYVYSKSGEVSPGWTV